jgi:hypothetical protein
MNAIKIIVVANLTAVSAIIAFSTLSFFSIPEYRRDINRLYLLCKTCEIAKKQAVKDFNNSNYQIVRFGLPDPPSLRDTVLMKNFDLKIVHGGCGGSKEVDCYNIQMIELLHKKFGNQIFPL